MQGEARLAAMPCPPRCCRATTGAAPLPGKRKLLPVSSTFRLPGDAVPAHMMFAAKAPRLAGEPKPSSSALNSQL